MTKKKSPGPMKPEDEDLWAFATRDVEPMKARPPKTEAGAQNTPAPKRPVVRAQPNSPRPAPAPEVKADLGPGSGLDGRTTQRLKRGQLKIDGKIDLHGMTQAQAHAALDSFIARGYAQGKRCVLVVTGKGGKTTEDPNNIFVERRTGVLRSMVPQWLNAGSNRARVLSIMPAQTRHGGDGALYVLLRRKR